MERSRIDIAEDLEDRPKSSKNGKEGEAEKQAVALTYKPDNPDAAPVVAASGKGFVADRILELAEAEGVPVRRDADLVELLSATDIGDEIPIEAFIAVAEVLRYVYNQNGGGPPKFD